MPAMLLPKEMNFQTLASLFHECSEIFSKLLSISQDNFRKLRISALRGLTLHFDSRRNSTKFRPEQPDKEKSLKMFNSSIMTIAIGLHARAARLEQYPCSRCQKSSQVSSFECRKPHVLCLVVTEILC